MLDDFSRFVGEEIEGRYVLCEVLGEGSYGVVFSAEERAFGEAVGSVALKLMRPKSAAEREAVVREVRAMAGLSHPNLVAYRSSGEVGSGPLKGCLYLATELAEGSLADELLLKGKLPEEEVRALARDLASALEYLHSQQAVHRDVKPENVLRCGSVWKLGDFGLVRAFAGTQVSASGMKGTALYMSPEAVEGQTGPHVDVWALGVVLQQAASGTLAYSGGSEAELIAGLLTREPAIAEGLPAWLDALVRSCLNKERSQRPSAKDLPRLLDAQSRENAGSVPAATIKDAAEARLLREKAERGDASAQNNLGRMYEYGRGVPQDDSQAVAWYRKSAEQGNADGQCNLGAMYEDGRGVPQDDSQAVAWYRKSAEQGNARAQNNLGRMYANGRGVPQDDAQAVAWYRRSAEQGNAYAQRNLGWMYLNGRGVPQDDSQAVAWYRRSAEPGHERAATELRKRGIVP